jgi:hypothetical protein
MEEAFSKGFLFIIFKEPFSLSTATVRRSIPMEAQNGN